MTEGLIAETITGIFCQRLHSLRKLQSAETYPPPPYTYPPSGRNPDPADRVLFPKDVIRTKGAPFSCEPHLPLNGKDHVLMADTAPRCWMRCAIHLEPHWHQKRLRHGTVGRACNRHGETGRRINSCLSLACIAMTATKSPRSRGGRRTQPSDIDSKLFVKHDGFPMPAIATPVKSVQPPPCSRVSKPLPSNVSGSPHRVAELNDADNIRADVR